MRATWVTDVLGEDYEARTMPFPADAEGEVVATLVRKRPSGAKRAVLYVHGYNDYFFQTELAEFFASIGYTFYAVDLRKHGRSLRAGQTPSLMAAVSDYFPELDEAVRIIREEDDHDTVVVNAHSTGGLITALWADARRGTGAIDALTMNSPFLDINAPWVMRRPVAALVSPLGRLRPMQVMPAGLGGVYGESVHADHQGDWTFDTEWKPVYGIPTRLGWLAAIAAGQRQLRAGLAIDVPVLVACSTASYKKQDWSSDAKRMDSVLDVDHIVRWAPSLGSDVTIVRIPDGMHDLALSSVDVRKRYYSEVQQWLFTH